MDRIWEANDLARDLGYDGATPAFWKFCEDKGLKPIHGKPFAFDVSHVNSRLASIGSVAD
ncbi:hypothetical protein [Fluviibacterium sp. S390]|uniref:hypothetical protein n=1 Tax=Fluviibacterium sp. S390 TaxID=3415139 RepID=UPI003C7BAB7B